MRSCACRVFLHDKGGRELPELGWKPVDPPHKPVLLINPRSGGGRAARAAVARQARERGIEAVVLSPGESLEALVADAVAGGADALGMAGGDGSLAVVAAVAVAHGLPFVCVPAGTRNHFALDVGVDRSDVVGALGGFTDPVERRIDVAVVNGRMFLNNVSVGVYGDAVRQPAYRDAKLRTLLATVGAGLGPTAEVPSLRAVDDLGEPHLRPAVVLVSNNPYSVKPPPAVGTRLRLDDGVLGIVVLDAPGSGRRPPVRMWSSPTFELQADGTVHAGIDGETVDLAPPVRFASRPAALRVRISARDPGVSPARRLAARPGRRPR